MPVRVPLQQAPHRHAVTLHDHAVGASPPSDGRDGSSMRRTTTAPARARASPSPVSSEQLATSPRSRSTAVACAGVGARPGGRRTDGVVATPRSEPGPDPVSAAVRHRGRAPRRPRPPERSRPSPAASCGGGGPADPAGPGRRAAVAAGPSPKEASIAAASSASSYGGVGQVSAHDRETSPHPRPVVTPLRSRRVPGQYGDWWVATRVNRTCRPSPGVLPHAHRNP